MLVESHIKHSDQTSGMREGANFGRPRANFRPKFDIDLPTCFFKLYRKSYTLLKHCNLLASVVIETSWLHAS